MAFLPGDTPQEVVDAYTAAFQAVTERGDFADISSKRVGKYPVFVGDGSKAALQTATNVDDNAKAYVLNWLKEAYGVELN